MPKPPSAPVAALIQQQQPLKKPTHIAAAAIRAEAVLAAPPPQQQELLTEGGGGWCVVPARAPKKPPPPPTLNAGAPAPAATVAASEEERCRLFVLGSPLEAPFLIGAGGRNISLVRKYANVRVTVQNDEVLMSALPPSATTAVSPISSGSSSKEQNALLAKRLAFSASVGGVLRWFVTPQATLHGYPADRVPAWKGLADSFECDLEALRSRKGHVCILLVARLTRLQDDAQGRAELDRFRALVGGAREALLAAMMALPPLPSIVLLRRRHPEEEVEEAKEAPAIAAP